MPAQPKHDTLSRLLELLKALPHHRWATPSELRGLLADRGFEVDLRPVQRDLKELQNSFPLDHNDKGKPHGWRWSAEQALKRSRDDGRIEQCGRTCPARSGSSMRYFLFMGSGAGGQQAAAIYIWWRQPSQPPWRRVVLRRAVRNAAPLVCVGKTQSDARARHPALRRHVPPRPPSVGPADRRAAHARQPRPRP